MRGASCDHCAHHRRYTDWVPYGMGNTPMTSELCAMEDEVDDDYWEALMRPTWDRRSDTCPRYELGEPDNDYLPDDE